MYYVFRNKYGPRIHILDENWMKDVFEKESILDYRVIYKDTDIWKCIDYCEKYIEEERRALDSSAPSEMGYVYVECKTDNI